MKLVCIAGLAGAGKSTVASMFVEKGFSYIRFGQIVLDEVIKRNLAINEQNERLVREELRKKHGTAAMAKLNIPIIKKKLKNNNVIADGLYSFDEYKLLKKEFKDIMILVAVYAPPKLRYKRLSARKSDVNEKNTKALFRKYSNADAKARDYAEIENLDKGGPIAMADYTILNTKDFELLEKQFTEIYTSVI